MPDRKWHPMNTPEQPEADLLELAYPYAMHAVTEFERKLIERRRAAAGRARAAEFDARVGSTRETLATLSILDALPPPAGLEDRLMRALDDVTRRRTRRRSRRNWLAAAMALLIAVAAGIAAATNRGRYRRAPLPPTDVLATTVQQARAPERPMPITRTNLL
ncbi:hypothetical protein SAMN04244553_6665 [Nocardia amikacinitolerans]|uniref:Anti-sigma-K factor RskA N-terminal domain-containing protein n=1 Tax=Nocardia amikacinitolerans TaxID=756689 RepID=A0A285M161_9NOCA|nr:hypothetical protein [Nocardia amikacinitolerans]SNY89646.1 hypothetical protein SAMN04244553_6665 [Nocardia amikacinitolerans]